MTFQFEKVGHFVHAGNFLPAHQHTAAALNKNNETEDRADRLREGKTGA